MFWGAWNSCYILGVSGRCWALAYVCRKNESTPSAPPPPPPFWGSTRAQKSFARAWWGWGGKGGMVSRFRVFCWLRLTSILQRREVHTNMPKKLYSKQSWPSLACLPAKCHFAGRGGCNDSPTLIAGWGASYFLEGDLYHFPGGGVRDAQSLSPLNP